MSVNLTKHVKKTTAFLWLSALFIPHASAESLLDALAATYMHSSEIKEAIDSLKAANEQEAQARSGYRPTLTMDASLVRSDTNPSGDYETQAKNNGILSGEGAVNPAPSKEGSTSRTAGLTVRQNLFQGGNTYASVQQAQANIKAARARLGKVVQDALFDTVKAYVNVLTKLEEIRALEVNSKTKRATLQATRDKFNVGEETRTSVAQAEAENVAAEASLALAQAELEGFKATYTRLTGKAPGQLEGVQKPAQLPGSAQAIIDRAILNHPSIIQATFEETSARREIDKLNSNLLPKVDAFASSKRTETDTSRMWPVTRPNSLDYKRNSNRTEQQIGVQFSLNLYDGGLYRAQKRGAAHTAEQKRQSIETLRRQITERIYAVWELFKTAEQRVKLYKAQTAANKVALSGTEEELRVGSKILLDVLNAQSKLVESQLNLAKAENQYYQSAYELVSLMGGLQPKELQLKVKAYDPEVHYQDVRYRW